MPAFSLETNVDVAAPLLSELITKITDIVAEVLEKPKAYVAVKISASCALSFGGTNAPAALCSLNSIGKINEEYNAKISERIGQLLEESLEIPGNRYYINFFDMERKNVGYNKTVF